MCGVFTLYVRLKTASHSRCYMELYSKSWRFPSIPLSCSGPPKLPLPHVVSAIIVHTSDPHPSDPHSLLSPSPHRSLQLSLGT